MSPCINVVCAGKESSVDLSDLSRDIVVLLFAKRNSGSEEPQDLKASAPHKAVEYVKKRFLTWSEGILSSSCCIRITALS